MPILEAIQRKCGRETPHNMRRCFMTGKQCIFRAQSARSERLRESKHGRSEDSLGVFVAMPYRPNLDTFYEWSLEPYLRRLGIQKGQIWRADRVSKTGYVMCEHICRRIQDAALVIVDLSTPNPNVFYELGLAVGLGKPLVALCDFAALEGHSIEYWSAKASFRKTRNFARTCRFDIDPTQSLYWRTQTGETKIHGVAAWGSIL